MEPRYNVQEILDHLERILGHRFTRPELAVQAVTHSSAKDKNLPCNERLEFLGDAILGQVVSEYLYQEFPEYAEGELSTMKSVIVSAKTLSDRALDLHLDRVLILGRGLSLKKSLPRSILCNMFEAVIAALYLDAGFEAARAFVLSQIRATADEILKDKHEKNYKSLLQDYAQRTLSLVPVYRVMKEVGPDHRKQFQILVDLNSKSYGPAWGSNKKEAEQRAAQMALQVLGLEPKPPERQQTDE
ncbi:MAG: ribonuclease III [Planctomycetes bacterium]|nr:ribonuclease III [Planctomycetota bacterium]